MLLEKFDIKKTNIVNIINKNSTSKYLNEKYY